MPNANVRPSKRSNASGRLLKRKNAAKKSNSAVRKRPVYANSNANENKLRV
jgi:hypothetical protein